MKITSLILTICFAAQSFAGLLFTYNRLALKDLDQMNKLIKEKIKDSKSSGGDKTIPLKEALQAVFSRPNEDFLIEKILPPLKSQLEEHNAWERTLRALVKEALGALKNPKAFKPEAQVTYCVFLENLIAELRPKVAEDFEKAVLTQIQDAEIELTKEAVSERSLRMMKENISPSQMAKSVLDNYASEQKQAAEAAAKAKEKEKSTDKK